MAERARRRPPLVVRHRRAIVPHTPALATPAWRRATSANRRPFAAHHASAVARFVDEPVLLERNANLEEDVGLVVSPVGRGDRRLELLALRTAAGSLVVVWRRLLKRLTLPQRSNDGHTAQLYLCGEA